MFPLSNVIRFYIKSFCVFPGDPPGALRGRISYVFTSLCAIPVFYNKCLSPPRLCFFIKWLKAQFFLHSRATTLIHHQHEHVDELKWMES